MNNNKRAPKWLNKDVGSLFNAVLKIRNASECAKFFRDLLTVQEIHTLALRWKVARMLNEKETYQGIEKQTGMSSATIARINRWLEYGEGGYKLLLKRTKKGK